MTEWWLRTRRTRRDLSRRPRMSAPVKLGLRLAVSVALLAFLITKIPADSITPRNDHAGTIAFLAAGLLMTLVGFVLSAWRWQRASSWCSTRTCHSAPSCRTTSPGNSSATCCPRRSAATSSACSRVGKSTGTSDVAFASVVIERLSGFLVLPLLTFMGFAMMPSLLQVPHAWIALAIEVASIISFVVILVVAGHPEIVGRFAEHANWMRFIGAVHVGVDRIRREPKQALGVLFAAFVYQFSVVLVVWCAIHALGVDVPNAAVLAFVPAVASGQVMPISLSGLGIREGLLVLFLHPLGVPTGRAIGVGLLWYGMMLVVSLLGAPAFAVGQKRQEPELEPEPEPAPTP